jgi:hypothetical protein
MLTHALRLWRNTLVLFSALVVTLALAGCSSSGSSGGGGDGGEHGDPCEVFGSCISTANVLHVMLQAFSAVEAGTSGSPYTGAPEACELVGTFSYSGTLTVGTPDVWVFDIAFTDCAGAADGGSGVAITGTVAFQVFVTEPLFEFEFAASDLNLISGIHDETCNLNLAWDYNDEIDLGDYSGEFCESEAVGSWLPEVS